MLFYAGWSPGDPEDTDFKMPTFDELLLERQSRCRRRRRALESRKPQKTMFKDFFDNNDPDKDGFITRDEWDAMLDYMAAVARTARSPSRAAAAAM